MAGPKKLKKLFPDFRRGNTAVLPAVRTRSAAVTRRRHCGSHRGNPKNFQIH